MFETTSQLLSFTHGIWNRWDEIWGEATVTPINHGYAWDLNHPEMVDELLGLNDADRC